MATFDTLTLEPWLLEQLKKNHITKPTDIQMRVIPIINSGADVIAQAPTGTGKTLGFLLPALNRLKPQKGDVQMLVLAPTRELAIQIYEETLKLTVGTDFSVLAIYGGVDSQSQIKKLNKGIDIVIATPGRLMDHMKEGMINLSHLAILVLDEADQMLLLGFKNEVEWILNSVSKHRQLLCFSATLNKDVKKLAYKWMSQPVECSAMKERVTLENIDQKCISTTDRWKTEALSQPESFP